MIRYDFSDKTVLVTGASRGIGAGILSAFGHAGATCLLHYYDDDEGTNRREAEDLADTLRHLKSPVTVHLFSADIRSSSAVEHMIRQVHETVGHFDILVNNAGILRDRTMRKMTLDDWHAVIETNLDGTFYVCKQSLDYLNDGGRIVNISSISGLIGLHGQANYAASKAGIIAITRVLAKELAKRRITVNAVAPAMIQTTILDSMKPEVLEGYKKQIPIGRMGRVEDIANAVLFLSSEESEYITGQVLPITGGWM